MAVVNEKDKIPPPSPGRGCAFTFGHRTERQELRRFGLSRGLRLPSEASFFGAFPLRSFAHSNRNALRSHRFFQVGIFYADGNGIICAWLSKTIRRPTQSWDVQCVCIPSLVFDLAKLPSGSVIETAYSPPQGAAKRLSTMGAAQQITETPSLTVESESSSRSTDNSAER